MYKQVPEEKNPEAQVQEIKYINKGEISIFPYFIKLRYR